jgi:hypothetical protein
MSDFALTFLRPAPPKMCLRPAHVRKHLFPAYRTQSMWPHVDALFEVTKNKSFVSSHLKKLGKNRRLKFSVEHDFYSEGNQNEHSSDSNSENDDNDDDENDNRAVSLEKYFQ